MCDALCIEQGHTFFAAREQHSVKLQLLAQVVRFGAEFFFAIPSTHHLLQFSTVRCDARSACVTRKITAFGVNQHGFIGFTRCSNHVSHMRQATFAVV